MATKKTVKAETPKKKVGPTKAELDAKAVLDNQERVKKILSDEEKNIASLETAAAKRIADLAGKLPAGIGKFVPFTDRADVVNPAMVLGTKKEQERDENGVHQFDKETQRPVWKVKIEVLVFPVNGSTFYRALI